jgi:hypothetical protein
MSQNTTRICDLPENIKMTIQDKESNMVHQPSRPETLPQSQIDMLSNAPTHRLPSRDIPMNESEYNDPSARPNYIPPMNENRGDYLREYENASREYFANKETVKAREYTLDYMLTEFQLPILIGILFLVFQLPIVDSFFAKYFSFLATHYSDGNISFNGILFKSLLFSGVFYSIHKTIDYLSF